MQPGINLNNLKYFFDAVEYQSISESARKNHVTQSAASQGIQKLEKALKISLMTHHKNCFKLTPEGQAVYILIQQIFKHLKAISDVAQNFKAVISGQINLVCTQSIAMNIVSLNLQKMKANYPEVVMNMKIAKMENICQMLKRGVMDIGIVVESDICNQFDKIVIQNGVFQVYSKTGYFDDGVYVDHINGLNVDKLIEMHRKKLKKELTILQELDSWQVLAKCAENGMGASFLPDFLLDKKTNLRACKLLSPIPYKIVAISLKNTHLSLATKAFLDLIVI